MLRLQRVERDRAVGMMEPAMTIPEADRRLGCAPSTIYRLRTRNDLTETAEDGRRPGRPRMTTPAWTEWWGVSVFESDLVLSLAETEGQDETTVTHQPHHSQLSLWRGSPSVLERVIFSVGEGHLQCRGGPLSVLERATFSVREGHFKCWRGSPSVLEAFTRSHNNASAYRQNRMVWCQWWAVMFSCLFRVCLQWKCRKQWKPKQFLHVNDFCD